MLTPHGLKLSLLTSATKKIKNMKDKVLITLQELENSLGNIESARIMVSKTVGAYKDVQTQVSGYSDSLRTVSTNIEGLIKAISNSHTQLTESTLNTLQDSLNRINTTVSDISKITGQIEENFKNNISESCTNFDEMIKASIVEMEQSVDLTVEKLSSEVQHLEKVTSEIAPSISKQIKDIESSLKIITKEQDNNSNNLSILKQNVNEIATETANLKKILYAIIAIGVILIIIVLLK